MITVARQYLMFGVWLLCAVSVQALEVSPSSEAISYRGRIDFSDPAAPVLSWPATRIDVNFHGESVAVTLDDELGKNYYSAFIDGDWKRPIVLGLHKGQHRYEVIDDLAAGDHTLTLVKRTEGEEGATRFLGLNFNEGAKLLPASKLPQRRLEIYGDSITSGMGAMAPLNGEDGRLFDKNSFMSYGAITARALGADYRSISQSGIGIMVSWFDFTMPDFYDQLSAVGDNDSVWDFSRWTPQVVVINLLQNDSWLVDKRLDPVPTDAERVQAYYDFIDRIHKRYPKALLIGALGSMDATQADSPWPGYIQSAVENYRRDHPKAQLATIVFPFTGYGQHPRVVHHQANAAKLTAFIRERMDW